MWARKIGPLVPGETAPVFLGEAALNVARPDVARAFGARFNRAGFSLTTRLDPGTWEVTAFVWNRRTGRWEDARSAQVTVR